ncbi:MAG: hypothetical protein ACYDEN_15060 [Acidimicrobiales bacterium]
MTPSGDPVLADPAAVDQLELEIRQLSGITFVGFGDRDGGLLIEVAAREGADTVALRAAVERVAATLLDGNVVVEVLGERRDGRRAERERLQVALPVPGTATVELHLAFGHRRTAVEADGDDAVAVARAVVAGLGILGLPTPFGVTAAHNLPPELGSGTIVLLEDARTGEPRRGLARGRTPAEAAARAVLNALNRFLQPSVPCPEPAAS